MIQKVNEMLREGFANPSSPHAVGVRAAKEVEYARENVAKLLGCAPEEVTFTSGGTESNNLAIFGAAGSARGKKAVTTLGEHPSVAASFDELERRGFEVIRLPVLGGAPDLEQIANAVDANTFLISMMLVNNELGSVYPVQKLREIADQKNAKPLIHADGVQAFGKLPFSVSALKLDLLSVSAHKIGGMKGCGALFIKKGVTLSRTVFGGGQERGIRSGTLNGPAIAGFGAAAEETAVRIKADYAAIKALNGYAKSTLPGFALWNSPETASPYIISLAVPGLKSEVLLHFLEQFEIYVSAGSACSSRRETASPVLLAHGVPREIADSTLRISLSRESVKEDIDALYEALRQAKTQLRGKA